MHILITGATGLIGERIISLCHERGFIVNYLTTSKDKIKEKDNLKGFYWNPAKNEIDIDCFNNVSVIINLAGSSISKRWTPKNKKKIINSRLQSIQTLNKALNEIDHNIEFIVSASAIGIYPNSLHTYYDENETAIDDSFLGDVVKKWENEAKILSHKNISLAIIRIGLVLSDKGGALPEIVKPVKFLAGAAFGSGKQWQSWIHINDLGKLFLFIIDNKLKGVYNGVAPNAVTNEKLVSEIASVLKKPLIFPNIPEFVLKLILGEMSYILLTSQRVSSKKVEEAGFRFDYSNLRPAMINLLNRKATL